MLNNADAPAHLEMNLPVPSEQVEDLLEGCTGSQPVNARIEDGRLKLDLPGNYGTILGLGQ